MADRNWLDVDGNWNNTNNWSGGAVPADAEPIYITAGTQAIVSNITNQTAIDPSLLVISGFRGTIGTPAAPLKLGTVTELRYNAPACSSFNFEPVSCTLAIVENTSEKPDSFYLTNGTFTKIIVRRGLGLRIGSATLTALYVAPPASTSEPVQMTFDSASVVTTGYIHGGRANAEGSVGTLKLFGGRWEQKGSWGSTNACITTIDQCGGQFLLNQAGAVLTTVNMYGGTLDGRGNTGAKTITTLNAFSGSMSYLDNGAKTITATNLYGYGGKVNYHTYTNMTNYVTEGVAI